MHSTLAATPNQASDQASGLRRLLGRHETSLIAFASARREGGFVSASGRMDDRIRLMMLFADEYARAGRRVAILDEYPAPGGIAGAYGVESRRDIKHVLHGDYPLEDVMYAASPGISVIPAARTAGMELTVADEASLAGNLKLLKSMSDCVMIDCVHRTQRVLSPIARHAEKLLVVVAANGDDLMPSYALIKRTIRECAGIPVSIIVARAANAARARATFDKLSRVAFDHLGIHLHYQGAAFTPGVHRPSLMQSSRACVPEGGRTAGNDALFPVLALRDSVV